MPCTYFGPEGSGESHEKKLQEQLDLATRLLCVATARLNALGQLDNPELKEWHANHEQMDKARAAAEKKAALEAEIRRQEEIINLERRLEKLKSANYKKKKG